MIIKTNEHKIIDYNMETLPNQGLAYCIFWPVIMLLITIGVLIE